MTTFNSFGIPSFLSESLNRMTITTPTPIQGKAIPPGLEGHDILASAQTGTGKTIAYLIPLITNLCKDSVSSALILAPTRELATQIQDAARALIGKNFGIALIIGGESMGKQLSALRTRPRLIIGTPGRITDHLKRKTLHLSETRFLVLDETDRMLDMGFSEALKKIVHYLPQERQTFMFSATMPPSIKTLSLTYLTNPQHISVGSTTTPTLQVKQETLQTSTAEKFPTLIKELNIREGSIIIFVKTKHGADRLAEKLSREDHPASAIHGDLRQRKRDEVLRDFRNLKNRIIVATDLAARGLDVPHIKHVINYDLPQCPEDYIHRIGRTGRAGKEGSALSLISPEDGQKWRRIHMLIAPGEARQNPMRSENGGPQKKYKSRSFQKPTDSKGIGEARRGPFQKSTDSKWSGESKRGPFQKPTDAKWSGEARRGPFQKPTDSKWKGGPKLVSSEDARQQPTKSGEFQKKNRSSSFQKPTDSKWSGEAKRGPFQKPTDSKWKGGPKRGSFKKNVAAR